MEPLSAAELRAALGEVAGRLQRRGRQARVYVVGGAAMVLAYGADRLTRDIDAAVIEGHGPLLEEVRALARERAWPTTWLNEQATAYMPPVPDSDSRVVLDHPALVVAAASPRHMLAMKARAARAADVADAVNLLARCGYATVEEVEGLVAELFPGEHLGERQRGWIKDVIATCAPARGGETGPTR